MLVLWVVLIFYLILLVIKLIPVESKLSWDKINLPTLGNARCKDDSQCTSSEVCIKDECIPKYRGSSKCNMETGHWRLTNLNGKSYAKCTCLYPQHISQAWDGGNCDVDKSCSAHGHLENVNVNPIKHGRCICDQGYYSTPNLECHKLLPHQQQRFTMICNSDEMTRAEAYSVFTRYYVNSIPNTVNCFKKPCSFNVLNGKPLKYTEYDPDYGCICDPSKGGFGVFFKGKDYLLSKGYHACGNIFENEPDEDIQVQLYTYFYIKDMDPISFIHFKYLKRASVVESLRDHIKYKDIQIAEDWRYSYAQYVFRKKQYHVHSQECYSTFIQNVRTYPIIPNHMEDCQRISNHLVRGESIYTNTVKLLFKYPVCHLTDPSNPKYFDAFILNPFLLSCKSEPLLVRSNGFVLSKYMSNDWYVELADNYFETYAPSAQFPILADDNVRSAMAGTYK